jgi:Fe2+ transport system protein FeoA
MGRMGVTPQRIFVVSLVAMPGSDPILALRGLLKIALRRFKLRCISVEEKTDQQS